MKQRYKYRIYPTDPQVHSLAKLFGCCRVVWNDSLASCNLSDKLPSNGDLQKTFITQAKKSEQREWLAEVSNIPLQQSIADLGVAWKNYFDSLKSQRKGRKVSRPKFKKRKSRQSARFRTGGFSIKHGKIYLAKIGRIKVVWSRELPSLPSSVTVIKDAASRYFVSFVVEVNPTALPNNGQSVGIDLGITDFAALSTGEKIKAPKPLKKSLRKLHKAQRKLSRKKKGSRRRESARRKVARIHARISDVRNDFLHKLSTRIIRKNPTIVLEARLELVV